MLFGCFGFSSNSLDGAVLAGIHDAEAAGLCQWDRAHGDGSRHRPLVVVAAWQRSPSYRYGRRKGPAISSGSYRSMKARF